MGQSGDSIDITKKELTSFLNSFYEADPFLKKLRFINTPDTPLRLSFIKRLNAKHKIFSENDFIILERQISKFTQVTFDSSYISNAHFMDNKEFLNIFSDNVNKDARRDPWDIFHSNYGIGYCFLSFPLFEKQKGFCILYVQYSIGWMGGSGEVRIYQKRNNNWKLYKTIPVWDS